MLKEILIFLVFSLALGRFILRSKLTAGLRTALKLGDGRGKYNTAKYVYYYVWFLFLLFIALVQTVFFRNEFKDVLNPQNRSQTEQTQVEQTTTPEINKSKSFLEENLDKVFSTLLGGASLKNTTKGK